MPSTDAYLIHVKQNSTSMEGTGGYQMLTAAA